MNRFNQPSTWAGLATLVLLAKVFVSPQYHPVIDSVSAAAAGLGVALNEKAA